jgi:hypothetical protein
MSGVERPVRERARPVALVLILAGAAASACKPPSSVLAPPNDIAFRVEWSGPADLDLYVKEPAGTEISRHLLHSPTGGVHTGDCNATPESMCANPAELVYWPKKNAPRGVFQYRVLLVNNHLAPLPIAFKVTVLHGSKIVSIEEGSVAAIRQQWGPRTTTWK